MHFFIDHAKLTDQANDEGFGPSFLDPTNKYDVSANFQLTEEAKALACQRGHIIVTDFFKTGALVPDLVNVILKPMAGLTANFPTVKYYIYRGIKRGSFFATDGSVNGETEAGPTNCDTVREMWKDWRANGATNPLQPAPGDLGFDASLAGTVQIEEIFGNSRAPLRARQVKEGEWIGTFGFSNEICFEVIVEAELLELNLDYARKSKVQIEINSSMTAHALRCEKEKILAFVDPAALFGMHFSAGVSGFGEATAPKRDLLATKFLSHFSTATRVYLDIRSDKGYSYNFYDNYGGGGTSPDLIKFKPGAATAFVDDPYLNDGWPLFSQSGWTGPDARINLGLRLRIDDNTKPLLFVEDTGHLPSGSKNFLDQKRLLNGASVDWSKAFTLKLDGSGSAGAKVCVATHVKLQYLKQKNGVVVNPRLLQFNHRLDTVFGGINLPMVGSSGAFGEVRNDKAGLAEGATFAHVSQTGMYFDADVVLLYGSSKVAHRTSPESYPTTDFPTSRLDNVVRSHVFPSDIVFSRWSIIEGGATVRLIDLSVYNKGTKNISIDGIYFLGLTRDELKRLQTTGFGPVHQRFLVFEEAVDQLDDNSFPYKKYEVKVQGLDSTGLRALVAPNPAVHVYGAGANMFCSSGPTGFTSFVTLPDVPPDPAMMKQWEKVFSGTYLFGDADVAAVSASGRIVVNDIGNNANITMPTVRLRARYFFPTDTDVFAPGTPDSQKLSARKTSYPLVVIVHGNGQEYTEYDLLARHLAHNGFIVASINALITFIDSAKLTPSGFNKYVHISQVLAVEYDHSTGKVEIDTGKGYKANSWVSGTHFRIDLAAGVPDTITFLGSKAPEVQGLAPRGRANVLFRHLEVLKHKFGTRIDDSIGLIGHSRGGEAVVRAADFIGTSPAPAGLRTIKAIISLAPTDRWEQEDLIQDIPYFVLYGSRDCDIDGGRKKKRFHLAPKATAVPAGSGGFSLYDRARNNMVNPVACVKSMAFVYGANHNGFITTNDKESERRTLHGSPSGSKAVNISTLGTRAQRVTARAYMNAFLRQHLMGETTWKSFFTGDFIPGSTGYNKIFLQYKDMVPGHSYVIDHFEDTPHQWDVSSSGQSVSYSPAGAGQAEGFLNPFAPTIDVDSPHETNGLKVTGWNKSDTLTFTVLAGGLDVRAWTHLSFRIAQVARRTNSPISTMKVAIVDANDISHPYEIALSRTVPDPHPRPDDPTLTKSAFMTVRIALANYQAHVDLAKVKSIEFRFPASGSGNVELDDIEFTI